MKAMKKIHHLHIVDGCCETDGLECDPNYTNKDNPTNYNYNQYEKDQNNCVYDYNECNCLPCLKERFKKWHKKIPIKILNNSKIRE